MDSIIKKMRVNEIKEWLLYDIYGNKSIEPTKENIKIAFELFKKFGMKKHCRFIYLKYLKKIITK